MLICDCSLTERRLSQDSRSDADDEQTNPVVFKVYAEFVPGRLRL
jgi:hypothetical protein